MVWMYTLAKSADESLRAPNTHSPAMSDTDLGMKTSITRRDFLGSVLLASGSALLGGTTPAELLAANDEFTGYGGVGEYSNSNGNTLGVLEAGHAIRDRRYEPLPKEIVDTGETYD